MKILSFLFSIVLITTSLNAADWRSPQGTEECGDWHTVDSSPIDLGSNLCGTLVRSERFCKSYDNRHNLITTYIEPNSTVTGQHPCNPVQDFICMCKTGSSGEYKATTQGFANTSQAENYLLQSGECKSILSQNESDFDDRNDTVFAQCSTVETCLSADGWHHPECKL